jgi:thiamine pyrophosphate-dependent acetolactate synthase large subunit-like protein
VIRRAIEHDGAVVCEFQVKQDENIYPMVPAGASLAETIDQPTYEDERAEVTA